MALSGVLAIVNPVAAGGAAARLWPRLESRLAAHFQGMAVRTTGAPGDAERWAGDWAREQPGGAVIAVGGDGTIHEIVNGLLGESSTAVLGVIPSGAGNDFARNTGVPRDPEAALARLTRGAPVPVDAARIRFERPGGGDGSRVFVNSTSVGVSPRANRIAGRIRRALPGRLCYALGGVLALFLEGAGDYAVTSGDRTLQRGRALNLTLANGACFGGGMRISPRSSPSDGALDLVVIGDLGRIRALLALSRLYPGTHVGMDGVTVTRTAGTVQIRRIDGPMLVEADGEEFEAQGTVAIDPLPGAIRLL